MGEEHRHLPAAAPWRLNVSDFQIPERPNKGPPHAASVFMRGQVVDKKIDHAKDRNCYVLPDDADPISFAKPVCTDRAALCGAVHAHCLR